MPIARGSGCLWRLFPASIRSDDFIAIFDARYLYMLWCAVTAHSQSGRPMAATGLPLASTSMHCEYPCALCIMAALIGRAAIPRIVEYGMQTERLACWDPKTRWITHVSDTQGRSVLRHASTAERAALGLRRLSAAIQEGKSKKWRCVGASKDRQQAGLRCFPGFLLIYPDVISDQDNVPAGEGRRGQDMQREERPSRSENANQDLRLFDES